MYRTEIKNIYNTWRPTNFISIMSWHLLLVSCLNDWYMYVCIYVRVSSELVLSKIHLKTIYIYWGDEMLFIYGIYGI